MALEVKWTLQAHKGLAKVISYLKAEWTFREILQLEKLPVRLFFTQIYIQNLKPIKIFTKQ